VIDLYVVECLRTVEALAYTCDEWYFQSGIYRAKTQIDGLKSKPKTAVVTSYEKLLSEHLTLMNKILYNSEHNWNLDQAYRPLAKADQQLIEEMAGLDFDKWSAMSASARETFLDRLIEFGNRAETEEVTANKKLVQPSQKDSGVTQGEKQTPLEYEKVSTTLIPHPSEQEQVPTSDSTSKNAPGRMRTWVTK